MIADRFRERFGADPQVVASAPGRVNLIGEHTDYNEGFVLPMAIDRRIHVAASCRPDDATTILAEQFPADATSCRTYVIAVLEVLREIHAVPGVDMLLSGAVPMGAGLASSAALELAVARALCALGDVPWDGLSMARLAQRAENEGVGVRCGIMDQMAASLGRRGTAMLLDCRTLEMSYAGVPEELAVVVMDSGLRRSLGDTSYNDRRATCERALGVIRGVDPGVRALRDVTPDLLQRSERLLDPVSFRRVRHVVAENDRPRAMERALAERDFAAAGQLMNQSHASLRDLYEVSSIHLDVLCDAARSHPACHGARMTGAGFGGCAIALVEADAANHFIGAVQPQYESRTYKRSDFFVVSADDGARLDARPRQNR